MAVPERPNDDASFERINDYVLLDLGNGPIDLQLGDEQQLRIVDPTRDLRGDPRWNPDWQATCLIIDEEDFDPEHPDGPKGYLIVSEGQSVQLGQTDSQDARIRFLPDVSADHLMVSRVANTILLSDRSTSGTYYRQATANIYGNSGVNPEDETQRGVEMAAITLPAPYRLINEDAHFVDPHNLAFGVFDGLGSLEQANFASALAAQIIQEELAKAPASLTYDSSTELLYDAFMKANRAIMNIEIDQTDQNRKSNHTATTAVAGRIFLGENGNPYIAIAHSGDSRGYLLRNGELFYLTADHTLPTIRSEEAREDLRRKFDALEDGAELSEYEYELFQDRYKITSSLGTENNPTISFATYDIQPGDTVILTTDGVHDNLSHREISEALVDQTDQGAVHAARHLVRLASERAQDRGHIRSKRDDTTALVVRIPS